MGREKKRKKNLVPSLVHPWNLWSTKWVGARTLCAVNVVSCLQDSSFWLGSRDAANQNIDSLTQKPLASHQLFCVVLIHPVYRVPRDLTPLGSVIITGAWWLWLVIPLPVASASQEACHPVLYVIIELHSCQPGFVCIVCYMHFKSGCMMVIFHSPGGITI